MPAIAANPNVIIVITDDQGYGDLGCHGNPVAQTPHLDHLHAESVRFVDFHAAPMCTPTRGQLLTGLDAARNGAVNVSSGRSLLRADLPTNAPHAPLWVPAEDRDAMGTAFAAGAHTLQKVDPAHRDRIVRFLAMIRNVDAHVGHLRDFLRAEQIDRNTILVFMTDNGSTFGPLYYNAGMRGAKCSLWEGGHRVPCFVHWPDGGLGKPRDIGGLTQVQDILPTLIDLCEMKKADSKPLDGISLADVLRSKESVPEDRILPVNYSRMPIGDYPTPDSRSVMRREGAAVMWKRWRLLEGTALYNLDNDPLQEHNVIEAYPEIRRRLLDALDNWWRGVESAANQVQRITIGNDKENPMTLSACEWRDVFVDQQRQVRIAERKNSYWHLEVDQAGEYQFELRRWPRESGLALGDACPAVEVTDGVLEEGIALPIARARLTIGRQERSLSVEPGQQVASFRVQLEPGPTLLHTWFDDAGNQPICGAYYVYVSRIV